jgi:hypothetical protein
MVKMVTLAIHRALEKRYPSRDYANGYLKLSIYQFSTVRAGIAGMIVLGLLHRSKWRSVDYSIFPKDLTYTSPTTLTC